MKAAEHKAEAERLMKALLAPEPRHRLNALSGEWQAAHTHAILATIPDPPEPKTEEERWPIG